MNEAFDGKVMEGARFTNVSLEDAIFDDVNLRGAAFTNINLSGASFRDINLSGVSIEGHAIEALIAAEKARQGGVVRVKHVSPILGIADMEESLHFYKTVLLFEVLMQSADYSMLRKEHGSIHLRLAEGDPSSVLPREIYIEVTGIEALWEHVKQFTDQYKTRELFVQDYGMKEFHIIAPNNCLVFVGERV